MVSLKNKAHLIPLKNLSLAFLVVKLAHFAIVTTTPAQFDVSSQILLNAYDSEKTTLSTFGTSSDKLNIILGKLVNFVLTRFFDRLVTWDAVYFTDLAANGIQYEHQFVFCPLWWRLIRLSPVIKGFQLYSCLIWATLLTNACHFLAAIVLYIYTLTVFEKARIFSPERMAIASSLLFICSPAAAFLTAPYSEAIASLCSFLCLLAREVSIDQGQIFTPGVFQPDRVSEFRNEADTEIYSKHFASQIHIPGSFFRSPEAAVYLLSGVFAALAFGFRANCLFLGLIYVYDLGCKKTKSPLMPLAAGSILGLAFVSAQFHSYYYVCQTGRGEWCDSKIPSLFAYAQAHYWNNGFLKYWTLGNIPNFIFGAPSIILSAFSVRYFYRIYPVERVLPVLMVNIVFLCSLLLFWHVQIVTRIHTFLPVVYWLVAGLLTQQNQQGQNWGKVCVGYFMVWGILQVSLFGAFLPPA